MDEMTRFGPDAVFLGQDDYHHHIGANSWASRGMGLEPAEGPGLGKVTIYADAPADSLTTPDGVPVERIVREGHA